MAVDEGDKGLMFAGKHLDRHHAKVGDAATLGYACGLVTGICAWVHDKYGQDVANEMAQGLMEVIGSDFRIPAPRDEGQHGKN